MALCKITGAGGNCQLINDRAAILQRKGQFTAIDRFNRTRLSTRAVTIRRTLESGVVDISYWDDRKSSPPLEVESSKRRGSRYEMKRGKGKRRESEGRRGSLFFYCNSFPFYPIVLIFHRIFDGDIRKPYRSRNSRSWNKTSD